MSKYSDTLVKLSASLVAQYDTMFEHNGNRGESREIAVIKYLSQVCPKAYGFSKGEIFDINGNNSGEVDIIIYDEIYSPVFRDLSNKILCPNESSYGAIEVKSTLTRSELENCKTKIDRYTAFHRPQAKENENYITPHIPFGGWGPIRIRRSINNPTYGVFAYKNSISIETLLKDLENNDNIDYIIVPGEFIYVNEPFSTGGEYINRFIIHSSASVAIWVLLLQMKITKTRLISINLMDLFTKSTDGVRITMIN